MTLLTAVQDVCAAVGVERPASVFAGIDANRTMQEMLACANEMAQRIAYDTRDWTALYTGPYLLVGGMGLPGQFNRSMGYLMPADFKRLTLTGQLWRSTSTQVPMKFISDIEEWMQRRAQDFVNGSGEWIISANQIFVAPQLAPLIPANPAAIPPTAEVPAQFAYFIYINKNCIALASGSRGDNFMNDNDIFVLDERILKLGMIWSWKQLKGSPYAEDMANYQDALNRVAGADKPAPIFIGRMPMSSSMATSLSYPFPV